MPPMAAVDFTGAQHRQPFDAWDAQRLRNRQRFAGTVPLGRDPSAAVAGSVRALGFRWISGPDLVGPFSKLASLALVLGFCAGFPICLS